MDRKPHRCAACGRRRQGTRIAPRLPKRWLCRECGQTVAAISLDTLTGWSKRPAKNGALTMAMLDDLRTDLTMPEARKPPRPKPKPKPKPKPRPRPY